MPGIRTDRVGAPRALQHRRPEVAADALARIVREERADVLTIYDANGGYGHPDHVQVHRVGLRAASLAGTPVVLEATVDRGLLLAPSAGCAGSPGCCRCPSCRT